MSRLSSKVALITGGARGIGAAIAREYVAQGAKVVITDILDDEGQALASELGDDTRYLHHDVADYGQWEAAVALAVDEFGGLNVLVNNAGIANFGTIEEFTLDAWHQVININLTGTFYGIKASVAALKASGNGSIINISSTAGLQGYEALPGYNASKYGVRGLTKSVALDLGRHGVRSNSLHPGLVTTPMTEGINAAQTHVAQQRPGRPEEIAQMAVFLGSDESSFSTGAEFVADGGETAGLAH